MGLQRERSGLLGPHSWIRTLDQEGHIIVFAVYTAILRLGRNQPLRTIVMLLASIAVFRAAPGALDAQTPTWRDGTFTDSTGRTILYRFWTRSDWNNNEPRGVLVYFHGNNTGTADELRRSNWVDTQQAFQLGLAVAVVASPGSRSAFHPTTLFGSDMGKYGVRIWESKPDARLIHELLQSGFNSELAVDHDRVIFMGGSQGTCLLNHFLHLYAGVYGGGFHLHCGCFWGPSSFVPREYSPWTPTYQWTPFGASYVSERVRVFVEATTEDFLHSDAVDMAEYYSQILGLDTRWDLDAPGGHCDQGATPWPDVWEWLSTGPVQTRSGNANDVDGDGIDNTVDPDDDNDGAPDVIDALPLEPRDWLDTDRDADGDGVDNAVDPFPLDPREWRDNDADGIGNILDADDDNDGLPDTVDPVPLQGTRNDQLGFHLVESGVQYVPELFSPFVGGRHPAASVHAAKPATVIYPPPRGNRQSYQFIELGDSAKPRFEIMIDRLDRDEACEAVLLAEFCDPPYQYFEHYIDWIYIDRNHNQDLTDDGPPLVRAGNRADVFSAASANYTVLEVPYASGEVLPYGIILSTWDDPTDGAFYLGASTWIGRVRPPVGEPVLVATIDTNVDGLFNTGEPPDNFDGPVRDLRDITCIDFDRNGVLNECEQTEDYTGERVSPVYPGQPFELDGRRYTISVAPSGHSVAWFEVFTGGALPASQPATFRLGPVDSPVLFSGDSSFQVEVPEGATRATFTLESADPDVDVDLYVRYGQDNAIQGGSVVSDYSSTGPTGNERIVVTPQSAPPLRAGTYYVSLMLRTTGAVAEVTLTAEFDAAVAPPAGDRIYYFPHLAVGAGWQTTITYINYSSDEVSCRTDFLSDQGAPLPVSFPSLGPVVRRSDVLPPGGSVHEETDVGLSAPAAGGWARAACTGPLKASLLFRQHDSAGLAVAEAGVNAAAVPAARFVTFAEQAAGLAGTGVAYANPSGTAAMVTFTAKDETGRTLDSVDRTLMPGEHGAQNMAGLFGLNSFTGSLEITSIEPIVTLSINAEAAPIFSSLPPGELDPSAQGATTYYFPHLAVGASWQTTITYINYSSEEVSCRTDFLSSQGTPLTVSFPGRGRVDSRTDALPPGGSVHEETDLGLSAPAAAGWARAACTGPVKASLLFRQYDSAGAPTGEAGVNAASVAATRFVTFAEQAAGQPGTAVAYANPSDTAAAVVTFTARDASGRTLDSVDRTLMPGEHGAQNMAGLFGLNSFTGSLEITSTEPIVSLSLNAEAAPVFSSLPPGEIVDSAEIPD